MNVYFVNMLFFAVVINSVWWVLSSKEDIRRFKERSSQFQVCKCFAIHFKVLCECVALRNVIQQTICLFRFVHRREGGIWTHCSERVRWCNRLRLLHWCLRTHRWIQDFHEKAQTRDHRRGWPLNNYYTTQRSTTTTTTTHFLFFTNANAAEHSINVLLNICFSTNQYPPHPSFPPLPFLLIKHNYHLSKQQPQQQPTCKCIR